MTATHRLHAVPPVMTWRNLERTLVDAVSGDVFWEGYFSAVADGKSAFAVHVAIFVEPFLQYMLEGRKTIESRFSTRRIAPYQRVDPGDVVLLKRASGPIVGLCRVSNVWFYRLDPASWSVIRAEFAAALCAQDPAFWEARRSASFASLMHVDHVVAIKRLAYPKRDRRGWVVIKPPTNFQTALPL